MRKDQVEVHVLFIAQQWQSTIRLILLPLCEMLQVAQISHDNFLGDGVIS